MKAIVITAPGGPDVLAVTELPDPAPGFLGGLEPVTDFNPIADLPTGVQFSFYGSAFVLGTDKFPLADIPLQQIIAKAEAGRYKAKPARVFGLDQIVEAHQAMEDGLAAGKMVVTVG